MNEEVVAKGNLFELDYLPFEGEWLVFWGGEIKEQNNHYGNSAQNHAFDFIKGGLGAINQSFGQDIFATSEGEVVEAVDGIRDNDPGNVNDYMYFGNHVVVKHGDVYSVTAHLKQGSVLVRKGDRVQGGQKIGVCGNSGNSSEPHLHFHIQDSFVYARLNQKYEKENVAAGVKIAFKKLKVNRELKENYSPVKGDTVSNG